MNLWEDKTIAIDVDNVLANTNDAFCSQWNKKYGTSISLDIIKNPKIVGSFRCAPKNVFEMLNNIWVTNWKNLKPIEYDIKNTIQNLKQHKAKIIIATTRSKKTHNSILSWLSLQQIEYDKFCFCEKNKSLLDVDTLIDDDSHEIESFTSQGRIGFIYDRPWNKSVNRSLFTNELKYRIRSLKDLSYKEKWINE